MHLILYIYTTPTYIDPCKFSAVFSIQASAAVLAAGGGKGCRVWWWWKGWNETSQPSPVCMWAVSCIVSRSVLRPIRPSATRPALVPSCPSPIQKSVQLAISRNVLFTSLEIQLLICSLSGTINSRDRKTNAFFRFLCTYCAPRQCAQSAWCQQLLHIVCVMFVKYDLTACQKTVGREFVDPRQKTHSRKHDKIQLREFEMHIAKHCYSDWLKDVDLNGMCLCDMHTTKENCLDTSVCVCVCVCVRARACVGSHWVGTVWI